MGKKVVNRWVVELPCHVARENELQHAHWRVKHKLRKRDNVMLALACKAAKVKPAAGRRRVDLHVTLGPRQRKGDAVCPFWKSSLDALTACGAIRNDTLRWCEAGEVTYERGPRAAMRVTITELDEPGEGS